jgi:hypothetical protein
VRVGGILYSRAEPPAWVEDFCVLYLLAMLLILPALQARERRKS